MRKFFAALLLLSAVLSLSAEIYRPFRTLKEIRTEFFTIIFPEESCEAAARLASFADETYREIAAFYGQECSLRLPVLISPDYGDANGYFSSYPYNRIVLWQAPARADDQLGAFSDDLRKLFTHELAHAVTANIRGGIWPLICALFGPSASPNAYLMMPYSMIEGAAVVAESRDGGGRIGDPYFAAYLRQDILEGKFRDFAAAGGAQDGFPFGSAPYIYGTFFSKWLGDNFGEAKFAELWEETGKGNFIAGLEGLSFFKGAFETVYGIKLSTAWQSFKESMSITSPVIIDTINISGDLTSISAFAPGPDSLLWIDTAKRAMLELAPEGAKGDREPHKIFEADGWLSEIDVSPEGGKALLSWARTDGELSSIFIGVLDLNTRRLLGAEWPGLREASWYPHKGEEVFLAIRISGFKTDIVLVEGGTEKTLLRGGDTLSFSSPRPLDSGNIAFIMREGGKKSIARLELGTGSVSVLGYLDDEGRIAFPENPRGLFASEGRLYFSYIEEGGLPRLGVLEGQKLILQGIDISGGVVDPRPYKGDIYYKGTFSEGMRICRFPLENESLAMRRLDAVWLPCSGTPVPDSPTAGEVVRKPYSPFPWTLLPYRAPIALMDSNSPAAIGLQFAFLDPTESSEILVSAAYDLRKPFADLSLDIVSKGLPLALSLSATDTLRQNSGATALFRETSGGLGVSRTYNFLPSYSSFTFELLASAWFMADPVSFSSPESPYTKGYQPPFELFSAGAGYSRMRENPYKGFSLEGFAAAAWFDFELNQNTDIQANRWKAEATARFALPLLNLSAVFYGAGSLDPELAFSPYSAYVREEEGVRYFAGGVRYPEYVEYRALSFGTNYYLFADISVGVLDINVQKPLVVLPLFLNRIQGKLGYRNAICGDILLNSIYIRLYQKSAPLFGLYSKYRITAYIEGNYAFALQSFGWDWGYSFSF